MSSIRFPSSERETGSHAIVIGGGIAGLTAARVLTAHFDRVTVVERDRYPDGPSTRYGVPQAHHVHILLERGMDLLEWLFPGLRDELLWAGAVRVRWPRDVLWLLPSGWSQRFTSGIEITSCTRSLLEWTIRQRALSSLRIDCLQGHEVTGLIPSSDHRRVIGVRHRDRSKTGSPQPPPAPLYANLIVDASGRNSRTPEWLQELGYQQPEEITISPFFGYASRIYAQPDNSEHDWKLVYLQAQPPGSPRAGGLFPVEGKRWLVSLGGAGGDYPPTDDDGFLEFARSLRSPILYETIREAEPLTPVRGFRETENRSRRYDRLRRVPENLVITGDAACVFNPVYGQGMSIATEDAVLLYECLREQRVKHPAGELTGLGRRFQRRVERGNAAAWLIATGEDLRYPTTEGGDANLQTRLMHRYLNRVIRAAANDHVVNRSFARVVNLQDSPKSLLRPRIAWPALRASAADSASTTEATELSIEPELL